MNETPNLTLDAILSLHGNRGVFESLVSSLRDEEAIAFVGAGASAGMYPLWGELINLLADHAVAEGCAAPGDAERLKADTTLTPQQRVQGILLRLEEARYRNFLKATFGPRRSADGRRYTATHAALLRLPFRGYVTTNYDPALEFARMDLRPDSLTTGTPTWQDEDEVHRWYSADIFKRGEDCPILWLHGYWQRPGGIVLDSGEYSRAYKPGLYRRLFDALWGQRHLVFVGFGFNDPQFTYMVGEYLRDLENAAALPRHVAIIGLQTGVGGGLPDPEAVRDWRHHLESGYHVRPLFYPVRGGDHSALQLLLEAVAGACGCAAPAPAPTPAVAHVTTTPAGGRAPSFMWFHEPTNDNKFVGREDEMARLDLWVRDDAVRAVGLSAVGGTGKTALVGHWLKNTDGWRSRPFEGLFAWSFYQNRDAAHFLFEILRWAHTHFGAPEPNEETDLIDAVLDLARKQPLVFVLDGLEVLQEGPEDARHGTFLDGHLRKFLAALCQRGQRSLAVLTSRFVFTDLERFLGTAFHQLELRGLPPEQGTKLLDELKVGGTAAERAHVSESLYGHPLGLRVFAGALPDEDQDQPRRFLDFAFRASEIPEGAPLNDKLRRLLVFYEKKLPPVQARLLSIVALFRMPVADETVLRLTRGLFGGRKDGPLPDNAVLAAELKRLQARGILSREHVEGGYGSACHPILRDHFRDVLLRTGADTAHRTADLLKGQPSGETPRSVDEIEPVLLAIDILLYAGAFAEAHELYSARLKDGEVFLTIPAPTEGLNCALNFVRDDARRRRCRERLAEWGLAFYLNEVGRHAMQSGHFELSLKSYNNAIEVARGMWDVSNMGLGLLNKSELLSLLGRLGEAQNVAAEATKLATRERDWKKISSSHGINGWSATLAGQLRLAAGHLALADKMGKAIDFEGNELESLVGIHGAELLVRGGHPSAALRRASTRLGICETHCWNYNVALCHWMLGWCELALGRLDRAEEELRLAEPVFHRSHLPFDLARLHVTAGEVALARGDAAGSLHRAAEALALAAPRRMRLIHADALVLRGRARMLRGKPDGAGRARDDAEEALHLAHECGYAWAERDALFLMAEAREAQAAWQRKAGNAPNAEREREAARRARADAGAVASVLVITEEDLAAAEDAAEKWLKWH